MNNIEKEFLEKNNQLIILNNKLTDENKIVNSKSVQMISDDKQ